MYTAAYMCGVITCHGSTAQQQSAFTLEASPTRETTAWCERRWSWVRFTREAESPCPRVEGPTPQLATKRSLVPGVLFFFAGTRRSLVPHTKTKTIFPH